MPPIQAPAGPVATQAEPKQAAANIAQAVQNKAQGKAPADNQKPEAGAQAGKAEAAPDPNAGKKRYVVNGKDVFLSPEQADAYVQKGLAFEPRMSELARLQQETANLQRALLSEPGKVLANLAKRANVPMQQLVERVLSGNASEEIKESVGKWYYENAVKLAQMEPRERENFELKEQLRRREEAEKQREDAALADENRKRVDSALATVKGQIAEALTELGLPKMDTPAGVRLAKEIADVMRVSYFRREPCTAKQAAGKVKERILEYQRHFYDALEEDKLIEAIGKDNAEKVRKYLLKQVKDPGESVEQKPASGPARRNERKIMTPDEFHDYLDDLKRTGK